MGKIIKNSAGKVLTASGGAFEVTAAIDSNITAGNIKKDVTILGVTGTYEGSGGGGGTTTVTIIAAQIGVLHYQASDGTIQEGHNTAYDMMSGSWTFTCIKGSMITICGNDIIDVIDATLIGSYGTSPKWNIYQAD